MRVEQLSLLDADAIPRGANARVQTGDLWRLGSHLLLCGDATRAEDVARLMAGVMASACVMDPPYNVGLKYDGVYSSQDSKTPDAYGSWLRAALELAESHLEQGSLVFVWQAMTNIHHFHEWFSGRNWRLFASAKNFVQLRRGGWMEHAWDPVVCWQHGGLKRRSIIRDWHLGNTSSTRSTPDRRIRGAHPCPRPLDTVHWLCKQATGEHDIVYDGFAGSGTTLIACEAAHRRCYAVEIEPRYCDIILRRWEQATGQRATLCERLEVTA